MPAYYTASRAVMPRYPRLSLVLCFAFIHLALFLQVIHASPTGLLSSESTKTEQFVLSETGDSSLKVASHRLGSLQKRWWDVIFGLEESTENSPFTQPQYTIIPPDLPVNAASGSEGLREEVKTFTSHILGTNAPTNIVYKRAPPGGGALNLTTEGKDHNLTASQDTFPSDSRGPNGTTKSLPHPRFRTLRSISGEWPPARLTERTYTPFINHNTDFPGHTFTINGTVSVATCAYGGPRHHQTVISEPTANDSHLINNEKEPYAQQTHEPQPDDSQDTLSPGSTETQSQTYYDWDSWHSRTFDWDWTDPEIQEEFQSQSSLDVPFVLVPRHLTRPLGGDWREYCYSTLVDRYPSAAIFSMENGVLKDYDDGHWAFRDLYVVEPEGFLISCLQRVPLGDLGCSKDAGAKPENMWSVFAGSWLELAGELEFWTCPNLQEREYIGTGDAARPLMFNSTVCRQFIGRSCEYKGLEIVAVKDC